MTAASYRSVAGTGDNLAVEFDWPLGGLGNVTLRRRDLRIGLEPDECYCIVTPMPEASAEGLDLLSSPPLDMAIEVEVTKSSIGKLPLYAQIGVREVWRWTGTAFVVLERGADGEYHERASSGLLPALSLEMLSEWTSRALNNGQSVALRLLREKLPDGSPR
ncbi:MAG TPA: Uma2 family endonuclease [Tepidisphaeraceae bacterium]|jgi:Uma2 family endonuclease